MPFDNAGNTPSSATILNLTSNSQTLKDWIGLDDPNDYYGLNFNGRSSLNLALTDLTSDANIELLNSSGVVIARSENANSIAESINGILDAGSYYIRVYQGATNSGTNYNLSVAVQNNSQPNLVWRNSATGENALWQMNGDSLLNGAYFNQLADNNWKIEGTADFNRDGQSDIVWRNSATGENALWYMNNTTLIGAAYFNQLADTNWQIEGTADFNRDGQSDIVWRNSATGENALWYMNNTTLVGAAYFNQLADTNWKIEGTADFNRDGQSDIVWRNSATGENALWYMNNTTLVGAAYFNQLADTNWKIEGTADFNRDGQSDIVWRNSATGENALWYMNNATLLSGVYFNKLADTNWKITGIATRFNEPTAIDVAGNITANALNIGTLNGSGNFRDRVDDSDRNDYYSFNLSTYSNFNLSLSGLTADANVQLLDSNGVVLQGSYNSGTTNEVINRQLTTGNYYIWIYQSSGNSNYNLNLSATQAEPPFVTLTSPNGGESLQAGSTYNITWNDNIGENVKIELYKAGSLYSTLFSSTLSDGVESWLVPNNLVAGSDYQIRVSSTSNANVWDFGNSYFSVISSIDPGNTLGTAEVKSLATFSKSEQVSASDNFDFYRFSLSQSGVFTTTLTGLTGDADVRLIQDINNNGVIDTAQLYNSTTGVLDTGEILAWQWERGTTSESIRRFLNSGTYYLQVMSYNNQTANYNLTTNFTAASNDDRSFSISPTFGSSINTTARNTIQKGINFWKNAIPYTSFNTSQIFNLNIIEDTSITGSTLAKGGSSNIATDSNGRLIPTSGYIKLSSSYLNTLNTTTNYTPDVIIHELGHALGLVGSLNSSAVNTSTGTYNANTYAGWVYGGLKGTFVQTAIPMTTGVGSDSDYTHWKEEVFGNETMTHVTKGAVGALSQLSLAALRDIGWNINYGVAQPYALPTGGTKTSLSNVDYNYNSGNPIAAGNSFSGSYSYSVNSEFTNRLYRINFGAIGTLKANLSNLTANADMRLIYDANNNGVIDAGEVIATSNNAGTTSESFNISNLAAGSYYIDVFATNYLDSSGNRFINEASYTLNLSQLAASDPAITIGSNFSSALTNNFGKYQSGYTYSNYYSASVGDRNFDDLFRYEFAGTTNLNFTLTDLTANADIRLIYDANNNGVFDTGEEISRSSNSGTSTETLSRSGLAAGTYYVNVYRYDSSVNTPYKLNLVSANVA
ncbi:MAG: pre-peptidase C-terminal domain-containing protein [Aulosira sp. ZfuCHP01]|nr:pre-peptidase C-terminal domain-containing protein [Aulosira sp. ZfuCHP01]